MDSIPLYSEDLIKLLDEAIPLKNPSLNMTDREVMYRAGQRYVVEMLLTKLKAQEDELLPE